MRFDLLARYQGLIRVRLSILIYQLSNRENESFKISNVKIAGITSCVPKMIEENKELSFLKRVRLKK